jgi:hypothetical protein
MVSKKYSLSFKKYIYDLRTKLEFGKNLPEIPKKNFSLGLL